MNANALVEIISGINAPIVERAERQRHATMAREYRRRAAWISAALGSYEESGDMPTAWPRAEIKAARLRCRTAGPADACGVVEWHGAYLQIRRAMLKAAKAVPSVAQIEVSHI